MKMIKSNMTDKKLARNWEGAYSSVTSNKTLWGESYVPYISNIITTFNSIGAKKVLDFPCGDGRNTIPLSKNFDLVVGADASLSALNMMRDALLSNDVKNVLQINSNLFSPNFLNDYFDAILCWDVLGHIEEPQSVIFELLKILRPNGILVCSFFSDAEPCVSDSAMKKINATDYTYKDEYFYRLYTHNMLEKFLSTFMNIAVLAMEHITWSEPPHEGFREYQHDHCSWAITIQKRGVKA
jgi:2-polyprenyl-3-methyl-5-hydroxy-6-metoxy-1,4-benzoquinol methylase